MYPKRVNTFIAKLSYKINKRAKKLATYKYAILHIYFLKNHYYYNFLLVTFMCCTVVRITVVYTVYQSNSPCCKC
jgi:hypothetical protein